ncbi:ABC transporter ATP-binding protein [Aedoeadaptatus coxii]|uniref:ABC transporter ATP-binding protein n=1 Tax=Aedoeadaptatus coxii TaxID=755172 RepID=UPI002AD4606B|nr:ABC transporter ATP-binding protein [Peptoniphilus coxii]
MVLTIENLNVGFEQYTSFFKKRIVHVVHDLNLEVKESEVLAIFGASGSGKSLLAHAILKLLPYNSIVTGKVEYKGKELTHERLKRLYGNQISFIPQTVNSLNPLLKVGRQSELTADKKDVERVYKKFGLSEETLGLYPHELSGGMLRRVLVSNSILSGARLIIADEPTPGLDKNSIETIIKYFRSLKSQGKTAVIITHDIEMALRCADRIAFFYDGTIIEVVEACELDSYGTNLTHPYSRALFRALPENGFNPVREGDLC